MPRLAGANEMIEEKVSGSEPGGSDATRAASTALRLVGHRPRPGAPSASLETLFRGTMGLFATGVTVIATRMNGSVHGMTANSVTSVSLEPLLMQVAINRRSSMCSIIQRTGEFTINILNERQEDLSRYFGGAKIGPPPASLRFESDLDGAPFIHDALAAIHCRIARVVDAGDHVIVLGQVVHFHDGPPASPLVYFGGRYCSLRDLETPHALRSEPRRRAGLSRGPSRPVEGSLA